VQWIDYALSLSGRIYESSRLGDQDITRNHNPNKLYLIPRCDIRTHTHTEREREYLMIFGVNPSNFLECFYSFFSFTRFRMYVRNSLKNKHKFVT